jgi:hypothetical protein
MTVVSQVCIDLPTQQILSIKDAQFCMSVMLNKVVWKVLNLKMAVIGTQVVECLPSKHKIWIQTPYCQKEEENSYY